MIKVYIDSIELFEKGKEKSVELDLPADKAALEKAFAEAEIQGVNDCEVLTQAVEHCKSKNCLITLNCRK